MDYRIEQLRYLLREDPSSRIFYQLGELLRREGEAEEAVEILRAGLERHPRYVSAWVCLGRSQRDLRALEEARRSFQTALDLDRENPVAARLLGETAVELEDWLGAVKAFKLTRALAGADDELDARIAMVEGRLDQDGRLERPRPAARPVRCLDVVNLSSDDPFSAASEDAEVRVEVDDVFATAEVPVDAAGDAEAAVEDTAEAGDAVVEVAAAAGEISVPAPAEVEDEEDELVAVAVETETGETAPEVSVDLAPIVDESSVGAWSTTMSAAGVSGAEAWTEPTGEIAADDAVAHDDAWAEPGAASEAVEAVAEPSPGAGDGDALVETVIDEAPPLEADATEPVAAVEVAATADVPAPPAETHEFDPIEATPPIVTDKRHELEHGVPLPTMTLAKLALAQDDRPLAMATLESLIERDPGNAEARSMLDELSAREASFENERLRAARATTKIAALQGWLDAVRLAAERRVQ